MTAKTVFGRYPSTAEQTNFIIRVSNFIGSNSLYSGNGGAICIEGNLNMSKSAFANYAATGEGGCLYLSGSGIFECQICCFSRSYCQRTDEHGGNTFRVSDHTVQSEVIAMYQCGYSARCGGDSTVFMTFCNVTIDSANITHCIGDCGSTGGSFRGSLDNSYSWLNIIRSKDHNMVEVWDGVITVEHANFVDNTLTYNLLYARNGNDMLFISDAYFARNTGFPLADYIIGDISKYTISNCYGELYGFEVTPGGNSFAIPGMPADKCFIVFFTKSTKKTKVTCIFVTLIFQ